MIPFITLERLTYIGKAEAWFPFIGKHAFLMERKSCDFLESHHYSSIKIDPRI